MNRTQIAFALSFVVHNISLIESSVILLTFFSACRNSHKTLRMRGWLANFLRTEIPSIHRIWQKTADKIIYVCVVCVSTQIFQGVWRRGMASGKLMSVSEQTLISPLVSRFITQKLSARISCATHVHECAHTHTHMYIYIYTLADFSQTSLSYSMNHWNNGMGRVSPNSISKALFCTNWFE